MRGRETFKSKDDIILSCQKRNHFCFSQLKLWPIFSVFVEMSATLNYTAPENLNILMKIDKYCQNPAQAFTQISLN